MPNLESLRSLSRFIYQDSSTRTRFRAAYVTRAPGGRKRGGQPQAQAGTVRGVGSRPVGVGSRPDATADPYTMATYRPCCGILYEGDS